MHGAWYVRAAKALVSEIGSEETGCQVLTKKKSKREMKVVI